MELIKLGEKTYCIKNNTNVGIYKVNEKDIYLIDTGNDKEAGKKILKIIDENNWNIIGIINTHSNADHIGGNNIIQSKTNCKIYTNKIEKCFTENPILEPSFLYGANPLDSLKSKFLMAKPSEVTTIESLEGLEIIDIKGHFFDMIGVITSDNIAFLGDSLFSIDTINKYHIFYIYNIKDYLDTLNYLKTLSCDFYIPSHVEPITNIKELITINENKIKEIANNIINYLKELKTFEDILKYLLDYYNLTLNITQYSLIGSTIKSYLTYLYEEQKITYKFIENKMYWIKN